jgi:predicted nuclease of predicted toxin-antitoxin system
MRILIDENLPRKLAAHLEPIFYTGQLQTIAGQGVASLAGS